MIKGFRGPDSAAPVITNTRKTTTVSAAYHLADGQQPTCWYNDERDTAAQKCLRETNEQPCIRRQDKEGVV